MCLIIYCAKGSDKKKEFLSEAILKASEFNPDGMGYALKRSDGSLFVNKGFFNVNNFLEYIKDEDVKEDDELLVHLRIGNEGKVNTEMSHPFIISSKEDEILELLEGYTDKPILAHNGTMKKHAVTGSDKSDTFFFIKNLMSRPSIINLIKEDVNTFEYALQPHLNLSRLCVMFPGDDETKLVGKWHDIEGFKFSKDYNSEYFPKKKLISQYATSSMYQHETYEGIDCSYYSEFREQNKNNVENNYLSQDGLVQVPSLKYPRESFKDWINNTHVLYMGSYFPTSKTIRDYTIGINEKNIGKCIAEPIESDYELGIFRYASYRIYEVKPNFIVVTDLDNLYNIPVPKSKFYELFSVTWDKEYLNYYNKYIQMVKEIPVTKSMVKKLESIITRASGSKVVKNYIAFRDIKFIPIALAIEFLNNAEHELQIQKTPELLLF